MRCPALAGHGTPFLHLGLEITRLAVPLAIALGALVARCSAAETPIWQQIIRNPATTLRTLGPNAKDEPISEEIWVGSDDTNQAGTARAGSSAPDASSAPLRVSTAPGKTDFAPDILRIRAPSATVIDRMLGQDVSTTRGSPYRPPTEFHLQTPLRYEATPPAANSAPVQRQPLLPRKTQKPEGSSIVTIPKVSHPDEHVPRIQIPAPEPDHEKPPRHEPSELQVITRPDRHQAPKPEARITLDREPPQESPSPIQQAAAPKSEPKESKPSAASTLPIISEFTSAILSVRLPKPKLDTKKPSVDAKKPLVDAEKPPVDAKEPPQDGAGGSHLAVKPVVKPDPEARITLGRAQFADASAPAQPPQETGQEPEKKKIGLLRIPKISEVASDLLRLRARKSPSGGARTAREDVARSRLATRPEKTAGPMTNTMPPVKPQPKHEAALRPDPAGRPEAKGDDAGFSWATGPSEKPGISDRPAGVSQPSGPTRTKAGESAEALFHTTSAPAKKAGLLFQPKSDGRSRPAPSRPAEPLAGTHLGH